MKIRTWFSQDENSGKGFIDGLVSEFQNDTPSLDEVKGWKMFCVEFEVPDIPGLNTEPIKAKVIEEETMEEKWLAFKKYAKECGIENVEDFVKSMSAYEAKADEVK